MPNEMSPEERLLHLIKNGTPPEKEKKDFSDSSAQKESVKASVKPESRKAQKQSVKKKIDTKSKKTVSRKSSEKVTKIEVFKEMPELVSGTDQKKRVQPLGESAKKTDNNQSIKKPNVPLQKDQKKAGSLPKDQAKPIQQPVGQSVLKSEQPEKKPKRPFSFITQMQWFFSGFNFFNYLLLVIFIVVAIFSFWHIYRTPMLEVDMPEIVSVASTEDDAEPESIGPVIKPFPYYIEQIGRKKLFKLVAPPPPPKPRVPAKRKKEKPKVDIAKKTKHLVLQGIIYDIGPPQAIIFNKKENKTIFAGNDTVIGDIKVKEIKRGKIILEFEDQTQEMSF